MAQTGASFQELSKQHEENGYLTRTTNGTGWQINSLDEYGELFVRFAETCKKPILDLGVAYGYTTKRLLDAGVQVVANDLSEEMLKVLQNSVTDDEKQRLKVVSGNALTLNFPTESFDGIWANRFFHFLKPDEVRKLITKIFDWLAPAGKICITAASPYFQEASPFFAVYQSRKQSGEEWPGMMWLDDVPANWDTSIPVPFHMFDTDALKREVELAGFSVEKLSYIPRPYASNNGKEGSGVIAVKPLTKPVKWERF